MLFKTTNKIEQPAATMTIAIVRRAKTIVESNRLYFTIINNLSSSTTQKKNLFLSSTFIYESILMKIDMNANNIKTLY